MFDVPRGLDGRTAIWLLRTALSARDARGAPTRLIPSTDSVTADDEAESGDTLQTTAEI